MRKRNKNLYHIHIDWLSLSSVWLHPLFIHSILFSDATVWKFGSRFGFRFLSSRNRDFGIQEIRVFIFLVRKSENWF